MNNPSSIYYSTRSFLGPYAGYLSARFLPLIGVAALCVAIWFYGSLLGYDDFRPLESLRVRLLVIGLLAISWVLCTAVSLVWSRRRDQASVDEISMNAAAGSAAIQQTEITEIHSRMKEAIALLRRITRKRVGYVYELPWYLIFGAPGSGKTTALTNSGLKFPLGEALGSKAVRGVAGTRNCNWWLTDEAILIDTAGRYTTQEDLNGVSKAGWEGFLVLLRKYRRAQPVNGALVTVSIGDLMTHGLAARQEEMRTIRQRLSELDEYLNARVPVYLVLTKADLLTGFVEFFDGFSKTDREQVWGITFGLEESHQAVALPERFLAEFTLLQDRVHAMLLERLQQEPDIEARGRLFRFPAELASLKEKLQEVLPVVCSGSTLIEAPLLRGIYIASATQTDEHAPAEVRIKRPQRSYFLSTLFKQVIFGEASLVAHDRRLSRHQLILRRGAYGLATAALVTVATSWTTTYFQNTNVLIHIGERINGYEELVRGIPVRDVSDADFLRILPSLDSLRAITSDFRRARIWPLSFGLDQEGKIESRRRQAYRKALNALLLPRMLAQLQKDIVSSKTTEETFDALKLYEMLGGLGPIDPKFVVLQSTNMFARLYPGDSREAAREALIAHAKALAEGPLVPINLDAGLIAEARKAIRDESVTARAYHILKSSEKAQSSRPWTPADALGALGQQAFERASGKPLREGIPGLFTAGGYRSIVLPQIIDAAQEAIAEKWVRGQPNHAEMTIKSVVQATLQLYFDDFGQRWLQLLADLRVRAPQSLSDATETTRILASNPGPIEGIAKAIVAATDLGSLGVSNAESPGMTPLLGGVVVAPDPYENLRKTLQTYTAGDGVQEKDVAKSPFAALQLAIQSVYGQLSRAATSSAEVAQIFGVDSQLTRANQDLIQQARGLPEPVDGWMAALAADIDSLAVRTIRNRVNALWQSDASICSSLVADRYPFARSSSHDIAISDFVRLFGQDGLFHTFFKEHLEGFVDTSTSPWTWRGTFGGPGPASKALAQFENADKIRHAFFKDGSENPNISINIKPVSLSDSASAVMIEIGRERVVYFHGPVQSKTVAWPSNQAINLSRVAFLPGGWQQAITETGDWSIFRLFDQARIASESDNLFRAHFTGDGQTADFEVQFGSVPSPFRLKAISEFSCPIEF